MTLRDVMAEDAVAVFCNPDEFGEEITYTAWGGAARTVLAVVDRRPEQPEGGAKYPGDDLEISIPNDATNGVTSIDRSRDTVTLEPILGAGDKTLRVVEILDNDPGMWRLRCR